MEPLENPPVTIELNGNAAEVLWQLFVNGPAWDGDLASKSGRDALVQFGLAERFADGWQALTRAGVREGLRNGFGPRKEKRDRDRAAELRRLHLAAEGEQA